VNLGLAAHGLPRERKRSEVWTEQLFGEDACDSHDHVYVPPEWNAKLPERRPYELQMISDHWAPEEISDASRLAHKIELTKDLDGITIFIPDQLPDDYV